MPLYVTCSLENLGLHHKIFRSGDFPILTNRLLDNVLIKSINTLSRRQYILNKEKLAINHKPSSVHDF